MASLNPVVVLGCAKSGTSLVAGTLRILSVNFGSQADFNGLNDHSEDHAIYEAISNRRSQLYKAMAQAKLNESNSNLWGIKHPNMLSDTACLDFMLAHGFPKFVLVYRDPEAIVRSQLRVADENDFSNAFLLQNQIQISQRYTQCMDWLFSMRQRINAEQNLLILSYEKIIQNPEQNLVRKLTEFLALNTKPDVIQRAVQYGTKTKENFYKPIEQYL